MKKIIISIIVIVIMCLKIKNKLIIETYNELENKEINLTILNNDNSKSLLINNENLIVITYINENEINNTLQQFNIKKLKNLISLDNIKLNINSENIINLNKTINIDNIKISEEENIIKINHQNNIFCIYENGLNQNLDECDFIWFIELEKVDFSDNTKIVFYDNAINKKNIEELSDKWVDSYILNNKVYYSLKIDKRNYDIIEINITK